MTKYAILNVDKRVGVFIMTMEQKNQMVAEYIRRFSEELNSRYKGIMDDEKIDRAIQMFINSEDDYETITVHIQKLAAKLIEDYMEFQKQLQEFMIKKHDQEPLDVFTLDLNTDLNGLYLSQQQIDLLMIVSLNSKEEIKNYVENICGQFPYKKIEDLIDIDNLSVEECKRKLYKLYQDSLVSYLENAELTNEEVAKIKLSHLGINGEELEQCVTKIKNEGLVEVLVYLENEYGPEFITKLNRFMKDDFENIKSLSYEQMVDLNEFIRNDASIDTIIIATGKYNNNVYQTGSGRVFDPYLTQKAIGYCLMAGKHMRYHTLFGHSHIDKLIEEGKSLKDHDQILEDMRAFIKQSFDFIERNNRIMPDGSMLINVVEVFNELVEKNKTDKNKPYEMVWEKFFGITVEEIVSCFDGIKKPKGVEFMYNETTLTESPYKRQTVERVLYQIEMANPNLIDSFGDQMHLSDEDVMTKIGINNLSQTFDMLKRIQDGNLIVNGQVRRINGKKIECTEHDFHFTRGFIKNLQIAENSGHILRTQRLNIKKNMQEKVSDVAHKSGVEFARSTYWSIFDKNDHNLCRTNIKIQKENKKLADEKKKPLIDTMHAGLVGDGTGLKNVRTLKKNSQIQKEKPKQLVKQKPTASTNSNGYANALILALLTWFSCIVMFAASYYIYK